MRRTRYLRPDDPVPAVLLGMALQRGGHPAEAQRTWAVTRRLLEELPPDAGLAGGYPPAAVRHWLDGMADGVPPTTSTRSGPT